jgi:glycerate 2-kinase
MKIILAPDSFKESLSAVQVARAMARGVAVACGDATPVVVELPIADGGEGTVACLVAATGGRLVTTLVMGPLGRETAAQWGMLGDGQTAVIEMAAASGLPLVPPAERNPLRTTTYGTGQLIAAALEAGARRIIVGIGGSATVDGGVGMARALGASFLDAESKDVGHGGGELQRIEHITLDGLDARLGETEILVAGDVQNLLTGPEGAARVFGPQKGATPEQVERLDAGLHHLAERLRGDLGRDVEQTPGAGAAGGLGAALMAVLGAELRPGIALVLDAVGFDRHLKGADLVVTGEGRLDGQSLHGKATVGVSHRARDAGVPCVAVAGSLGSGIDTLAGEGIVATAALVRDEVTVEEAMADAARLVEERTGELVRKFLSRDT